LGKRKEVKLAILEWLTILPLQTTFERNVLSNIQKNLVQQFNFCTTGHIKNKVEITLAF